MPLWGKKFLSIHEILKEDEIELLGKKQPKFPKEHVCQSGGGAGNASLLRKQRQGVEKSSKVIIRATI